MLPLVMCVVDVTSVGDTKERNVTSRRWSCRSTSISPIGRPSASRMSRRSDTSGSSPVIPPVKRTPSSFGIHNTEPGTLDAPAMWRVSPLEDCYV